jgi:hypothetical protein
MTPPFPPGMAGPVQMVVSPPISPDIGLLLAAAQLATTQGSSIVDLKLAADQALDLFGLIRMGLNAGQLVQAENRARSVQGLVDPRGDEK